MRQLVTQALALLDLRLTSERDHRPSVRLPSERGQLRRAEHRRQRRGHRAAVKTRQQSDSRLDRVPAEQQDDIAAPNAARGESRRQPDGRVPELPVADLPFLDVESDLGWLAASAVVEFAPEVACAPVAL